MPTPSDDEVTRRREAAAARLSGYYWVAIAERPARIRLCHWTNDGEGDGLWRQMGSEFWLDDAEVFVVSGRLERPEANIGWPDWAIQIPWEG